MSSAQSPLNVDKLIAQNLNFYHSIKPKTAQDCYTVIATLNDVHTSELVALATGTQAGLKRYEDDIEDCHAESLVKRAYKRYVLDRILFALDDNSKSHDGSRGDRVSKAIKLVNQQELVLFISQFPCGLINRFSGPHPLDEETGTVIVKKPGRGQMVNGKTAYVQRDTCLDKIKRWTSGYGLQGKLIGEKLGLQSNLTMLVIGDCESDPSLDHQVHLDIMKRELSFSKIPIQFRLVHMRHEDFTFGAIGKRPLPVGTIWWASDQCDSLKSIPEYVVDGRRLGMTKKQCIMNSCSLKLRTSDYWLHADLKRICEVT